MEIKMRLRIGTKLILGFMLFVFLMTVISLYSVMMSKKSLQESVGQDSIFLVEEMLKRIDKDIFMRLEELQNYTKDSNPQKALFESNREFEKLDNIQEYINQKDKEWVSAPKEAITSFMQKLIDNPLANEISRIFIEFHEKKYGYKLFGEVFVSNKYGANIAQTGKTSDYRQDDEKWWQIARNDGFYISDIEYDESVDAHSISIGVRIEDENGDFLGVMKGVIAVSGIIKETEIATKKYETTEIKLVTNDGNLFYATKPFKILENVAEKDFFKKLKNSKGFFVEKEGGREKLFSYSQSKGYRNFRGLKWFLVVGYDVKEILKPIFLLRQRIFLISAVVITISIFIALFISFSISNPIKKLTKASEEISKGKLDIKIGPKLLSTNDEISVLARTFNQMIESLENREKEVIQRTKELESSQASLLKANEKLQKEILERKLAEDEVRNKAGQLKTLYETGKKITSIVSKEELLPWIAEQAAKLLNADECLYRIREGDYLIRGGGTKKGMELMETKRLKIGESFSGIIVKEKRPLISKDMREDERYKKEHREVAKRLGLVSFLGVPMCIEGRVVGVLNIMSKKTRKFTEADIELLSAFADHSAIALEKVRLFSELKEAKDEIEKWGKDLEGKVENRTRELKDVQVQLIHSERLAATGRLAASIAHEINNPLQAIDSFVSTLMKRGDKKSRELLGLTQEGINRIARIVRQLLAFHRPETEARSLEDINSIAKKTLSLTKNQLSLSNVKVVEELSSDLPKVMVSSQQMHQVLLNLI
ncbi:MAG: GAF domain-containing protein, partial [Candidatus Wukongarchaeota archaeon]|nr:GAF domain-containing protein [Candidatus Wukongarchaeota archaeon]